MCLAYGLPLILWDFRGTGIAISLELEKSYKEQLIDKMCTFSEHFLKISLSLRNTLYKKEDKDTPCGGKCHIREAAKHWYRGSDNRVEILSSTLEGRGLPRGWDSYLKSLTEVPHADKVRKEEGMRCEETQ